MSFLRFLEAELAPRPGRARATARTVVAALATTLVTQALHAPNGHWAVFTVFVLSQPDAGASVEKAVQRFAGTLAGGLLALFAIVAFVDQPWFLLPLIFAASGGALYLSGISTAPYAPLLGALTFVMFLPEGHGVAHTLDAPLWRMVMILLGAGIGTLAQLLLWPDDPGELLRHDVAARLRVAAAALERISVPGAAAPALLEASGLARELQLLASGERLHPARVHRHAEQARLIAGVERALVAALALERAVSGTHDAALRVHVAELAARCRRLADGVGAEVASGPVLSPPSRGAAPADVAARPSALALPLAQLEAALTTVQAAATALAEAASRADDVPPPRISLASWLPLSRVTPDPETPRIAARAATATTLAYVVMHGLAWPGISTILVTPVVCAQSSFGASRQKALLRIGGTAFGALLGIGTTVALVPLVTSIAGLLVILVPSFWIAAWVSMGSPRIAYAGIQIALAFAMYGDAFGPGTELVMGRDRVIGIALGIVLMAALEQLLWPQYAGSQLARRLAAALRAQAGLARAAIEPLDPAVRDAPERWRALDAYRALTVSLATIEESRFEPGGPADEATRAAALALTARAQDVMLTLVTLARAGPPTDVPSETWRELAEAQAEALAAIADRLDGARPAAVPLERLERALGALEAQHGADRLTLQRTLAETLRRLARSPEIERLAALAPARAGDPARA